ncbi:MAG TPA: oligopeptide transporter, OPT family, partial [Geobacterales bacterium]|nr:oligopeptide transporter, OPT family [Geobacterales bacterium]
SSSIPAAIISMSVLRALTSGGKPAGILENNIVQTQASAAGTLCNVILVLPGLLLIGFWHDFPLWQTMAVCLLGGLLGVAYSVPLRRVMVVGSSLPFPEGVAAAEVLRAGHKDEEKTGEAGSEAGLKELGLGAAAAAGLTLLTTGFKFLPDKLSGSISYGGAVFQMGGSLSLALIGVGYLVRIGVCLALFLGLFIAWGVAVPVLMTIEPSSAGNPVAAADAVWSEKVRLIGAGIIASGGLWTVLTLIKPLVDSVRLALQAHKHHGANMPREENDIPIAWIGGTIAVLCILTGGLFAWFVSGVHLAANLYWVVPAVTLLTMSLGLLMASACGYLAALLGSSCSPISGIGILSTILIAAGFGFVFPMGNGEESRAVVALTLFIASIVVTVSSIANDNLQDLKTGNMVGATPWKQQVALAIGVVAGAITIVPVLQLLYSNYGFVGSLPRAGMLAENAMAAPQASLMTQIANGIIHHQLAWNMIGIGAALGVALVALESWLWRKRGFSLPALTVGIGIYLPYEVSLTIAIGGVIGWFSERAVAKRAANRDAQGKAEVEARVRRRGVLIASGFLVGESMTGVLLAAADAFGGRSGSLAFSDFAGSHISTAIAALLFASALAVFYRLAAHTS